MTLRIDGREKMGSLIEVDLLQGAHEGLGVHAAWLRLPSLPLERERRPSLVEVLALMRQAVQKVSRQKVRQEVYLQMAQLERPGGSRLIGRNGSYWKPALGLGVWPDREAPRPLGEDDFKNLAPGQRLQETTFQVMHISAHDDAVRSEVIAEMAGTGALLTIFVADDWGVTQRDRISEHLESRMTEEAYQGYPFYFPLLDGTAISSLNKEDYDALLPDVVLYLREDIGEQAILIVSRIPFDGLFPKTI
jgi:hypothetical protein